MKKAMVTAAVFILFATAAVAADNTQQPMVQGHNFEQHRADILKRIDERIVRNREEKSCVQAAKNHEDIKACQDKFKAEVREQRQKNQ